jgi:addiction module RelE/StbE family toxin
VKIVYAPLSQADLRDIRRYISEDNPQAAQAVIVKIRKTIRDHLTIFPEMGRPWQEGPTRALSLAGIPYRIHYRVKGDTLEILRIYHTARLPPEL